MCLLCKCLDNFACFKPQKWTWPFWFSIHLDLVKGRAAVACEDLALATWRAVRLGGTGAVGRAGRRLGRGVNVALTEG